MTKRFAGLVAAIVIAAAAGVRGQGPGPFDYHRITGEIVWRGTQALKLCNGLFVSGRTVDQVYAQEFAGMGTPMPRQRIEIDRQLKSRGGHR